MKAFLMYRDRDFDPKAMLPVNEPPLVQDLELETLFGAMARDDAFIRQIVRVAILTSVPGLDDIAFRQSVLTDCLGHPDVVRRLYTIATDALERERKFYFGLYRESPASVLHRSLEVVSMFMDILREVRQIVDQEAPTFRSDGFRRFFSMLQSELTDAYFDEVKSHLRRLRFDEGLFASAALGDRNEGIHYVLRLPPEDRRPWPLRFLPRRTKGLTLHLHPRDEAGSQALGELRGRGIAAAASALGLSADHLIAFFTMVRTELAFFVGCVNLAEKLEDLGMPITFPHAAATDSAVFSCTGLYDVCLALSMNKAVVGNDISGDGKRLLVVTGANQGGKSTFLRSTGVAQLMMQAGLFVAASTFAANVVDGVVTHYKREEDSSMQSGKLEEELVRMSDAARTIRRHSLVLFNESFASTNEREGSEIARQVVTALLDHGAKVYFVTHLYDFAHSLYEAQPKTALFLRAERRNGGTRSFKLSEGEPLDTSFGEDLYEKIFSPTERLPEVIARAAAD